ncbi:hypothetical protein [Archaeoglobus sp.]
MPLTVKVWKLRPNYKAFALFTVTVFSVEVLGFILSMINSVFLVIVLSVFVLIPIWVASLFLFGGCECITVNVLGEAEVSTWNEVKRFWWLFAIVFLLYVAFAIFSKQYYYVLEGVWIVAFFILFEKKRRLKVKITDLGLVFNRLLLLSWNDIENAEILDDTIVLKGKGRIFTVSNGSIPKEILNNITSTKLHVYNR